MEKTSKIKCCGKNVWWMLATEHEDFANPKKGECVYPGASIFYCDKCTRKSKWPCYSTLGTESVLKMLVDEWNGKTVW